MREFFKYFNALMQDWYFFFFWKTPLINYSTNILADVYLI